jgi:hypothetical protein
MPTTAGDPAAPWTWRDSPFTGALDLGNPDRETWASATRTYLDTHPEVNVIIWSWCGQADTTEENIETYLSLMEELETNYPHVSFVYMTGTSSGRARRQPAPAQRADQAVLQGKRQGPLRFRGHRELRPGRKRVSLTVCR